MATFSPNCKHSYNELRLKGPQFSSVFLLYLFVVLGIEPRVLHMPCMNSTIELHPQPLTIYLEVSLKYIYIYIFEICIYTHVFMCIIEIYIYFGTVAFELSTSYLLGRWSYHLSYSTGPWSIIYNIAHRPLVEVGELWYVWTSMRPSPWWICRLGLEYLCNGPENILGFSGWTVSFATTQLYYCGSKTSEDKPKGVSVAVSRWVL
jgi:hypothetical protein